MIGIFGWNLSMICRYHEIWIISVFCLNYGLVIFRSVTTMMKIALIMIIQTNDAWWWLRWWNMIISSQIILAKFMADGFYNCSLWPDLWLMIMFTIPTITKTVLIFMTFSSADLLRDERPDDNVLTLIMITMY